MEGKDVVVTGGLGFIGSHIVDELVKANNVTIIDNFSSGKLNNLDNPEHENLEIIEADLNDVDLNEIFNGKDYVFHLAALASVPGSVADPLEYNKTNVDATVKLLIAAKNQNIKKVVFSSSSAIYGENPKIPLKESEPYMPLSPYASQKASCELYLKSFYESYGLNYIALRYFNVFGPRQDINSQYAAVIPKFIHSLINGEQAIIYGDGEQSRDFIFVKNIVKANIKAAESDYNGVVNIASGEAITINQLYYIIKDVLGSDFEPKYLDERSGDIKHSAANIENLKNINLEINNSNFKKQLEDTVEWFKNNYNI